MGRLIKFLFGTLSILVALIAIGIGYLKLNDVYRQKGELKYLINYFLRNCLVFARFLNKISDVNNTAMMDIRCHQVLIHSNVQGQVLEIGSGTGINFACLHNNTNIQSYVGVEPNVNMYPYFYDFIKQWKVPYEIRLLNNSATDMHEVKSNSIDTVIMTLVLCSVPDPLPEEVLREAHRVLKSGGKFVFFEHIAANYETDPFIYGFQKMIEPIWAIIGDGCRFKRSTNYFDAMKNVYSKVEYQHSDMPTPFFFIKDAVKGQLIK